MTTLDELAFHRMAAVEAEDWRLFLGVRLTQLSTIILVAATGIYCLPGWWKIAAILGGVAAHAIMMHRLDHEWREVPEDRRLQIAAIINRKE